MNDRGFHTIIVDLLRMPTVISIYAYDAIFMTHGTGISLPVPYEYALCDMQLIHLDIGALLASTSS